jgi:hypothetical protein
VHAVEHVCDALARHLELHAEVEQPVTSRLLGSHHALLSQRGHGQQPALALASSASSACGEDDEVVGREQQKWWLDSSAGDDDTYATKNADSSVVHLLRENMWLVT